MLGNVSHNKNNPLAMHMCAVSADLKCSLYKLKWLFRVEITELRCKSLQTTNIFINLESINLLPEYKGKPDESKELYVKQG